jgi:multiple sugar transport system permease protein
MLSPTLFFTIIMTSIASFRVFDMVFIMTQGGPAKASYVYVQHIYEYGFRFFRMGESSAAAVVFFLALLMFTIFQFKGSRGWVNYDS